MLNSKTIQIKEYEEKKDLPCDLDLIALEKYLNRNKLSSAFKITPSGIKAKSFVGIIKFKNTQFEILPKLISDSENDKIILENLIFMLSYTKNLDIKTTDSAKISQSKNPFLEVLIKEFSQGLFDCLKRLTPKNYIREEENLNFLKGKLKFSDNIKYNSSNQAKFYCEFDEFSEDNLLNQLFYYVSNCLYTITKNSNNKKLLKLIIDYYCDIKLVRFDKFKADKIKLTRNQELFKKPFKLAKMFVENSSVDLSKNNFENITLLWDMNKLFEEFIYQVIKKHNIIENVSAQKTKRLLRTKDSTNRDTKTDIFTSNTIIDKKYKKFESFDDISSADIYQVSTYCLIHHYKQAILLYPQWNNTEVIEKCLNTDDKFENCDYKIKFAPVNLRLNLKEDLKSGDSEIVKELKNILKPED